MLGRDPVGPFYNLRSPRRGASVTIAVFRRAVVVVGAHHLLIAEGTR